MPHTKKMKIELAKYAKDPMLFFESLHVPSATGPKLYKEIMQPYQRQWYEAVCPSLVALAHSKEPPIKKFFVDAVKGTGKDWCAGHVVAYLLAFSKTPLTLLSGSHDKQQTDQLRLSVVDVLRLNPFLKTRLEIQTSRILCKATNSELTILSTDSLGSHGSRPHCTILNELSHVADRDFAETLLDNQSKKPWGLTFILTNAGFKNTWQFEWMQIAKESDEWHYTSWSFAPPWMPSTELEQAKRRNSKNRFARLYEGEWTGQSGDALDESDILAAVDPNLRPLSGPRKNERYISGLDLAVSHDRAAMVIVSYRHDSQMLTVVDVRSWSPDPNTKKIDLMDVERSILAVHSRFNLTCLVADPYQSELLCQRVQRQGLATKLVPFVGQNLDKMARSLLDVFRSARIRLYPHDELQADLQNLSIEERSYGHRLTAERTKEGHADTAISLALCLPLCVEESARVPVVAGALFRTSQPSYEGVPRWLQNFEKRKRDLEAHEQWLREENSNEYNAGFLRAIRSKFRNP